MLQKSPPVFDQQAGLSAIQRLALGFLVETEDHCPHGLVQVQPDHVNQLVLEARIVREFKAGHLPRFQLMIAPVLRHLVRADAETASQPSGAPVRRAVIGQLVLCNPDHLRNRPVRHRRLTAPTLGDASHPCQPIRLEATLPGPHRGIGRTTMSGHLVGRHPIGRQQQRLGLRHLAMRQRPGTSYLIKLRMLFVGQNQRSGNHNCHKHSTKLPTLFQGQITNHHSNTEMSDLSHLTTYNEGLSLPVTVTEIPCSRRLTRTPGDRPAIT